MLNFSVTLASIFLLSNKGESAASFYHQVAALFPDMFCNYYLVTNHKIAKISTTTKAREKISTDFESLIFQKNDVCLSKFQNTKKKLLNKMSHRFLQTTMNQAVYWVKESHWLIKTQ